MSPERRFALDGLPSVSARVMTDVIPTDTLRRQANWIRDDIDPMVARHGPESLQAEQLVMIEKFFHVLRHSRVSAGQLRASRLHLAILLIASIATRWPTRFVTEAEAILRDWTAAHGSLNELGMVLYEEGGRLHGICSPSDSHRDVLESHWNKVAGSRTINGFARRHGDLGFKPGDWWINPMFAYHAGIIDSGDSDGRIICDEKAAYAVLLTKEDEVESARPDVFTYRAKLGDPGIFRLTSAGPTSRQPIRVLRSHTLRSFWSPLAGLRYDGLFKVTGWRVRRECSNGKWTYWINFERVADQEIPMKQVLRHPLAAEVEDYVEYKRLRRLAIRESRRARTSITCSPEPAMETGANPFPSPTPEPKRAFLERQKDTGT